MSYKGYSLSVIGSREMNQDSFLVAEEQGLFAVADGVGGGLKGEVASKMAVEGFRLHALPVGSLVPVVERLQADIYKEAMDILGEPLMGTTFTGIRARGDEVTLVHVGDSHCYHFTGGLLKLLTEDHESYEEALGGPVLSSYLGMPTDLHTLKIQEEVFSVGLGDLLLLCSDGLHRQISERQMIQLFKAHLAQPEMLVTALCAEASAADMSDNVTVVLVQV